MSKILLWGPSLVARTGYGKNLLNLGWRLQEAGHETAQFAFGGLRWGTVPYPILVCSRCEYSEAGWHPMYVGGEVCPKCGYAWKRYHINIHPNGSDDYGQQWLPRWFKFTSSDVILFHYDCWILGTAFKGTDLPIIWYAPMDHSPCPPTVKETLDGQKNVIAFTRFAQREFEHAGIRAGYIPHAISSKLYSPGSREEAREKETFPQDAFIIASIATNKGPRKNLANILRAYRKFLDMAPEAWENAFLYFHCNISRAVDNPMGYELPQIWNGLDVVQRIKYVHPIYYEAFGFSEEELVNVYRSADWTILCSEGEGFGIPAIESLGCGTPLIYSDFGPLKEVVGPGGLPVEAVDRVSYELSPSFMWVPSTDQIAQRMVEAYRDWQDGGKLRDQLGRKGRNHVLRNYTWNRVMPKWLNLIEGEPKLEAIELPTRSLSVPGEVDIIVITWNGLDFLRQCVDALYAHTQRPFHLVIVDDHSTDGTSEYGQALWRDRDNVTYLRPESKARGGSEVMNRGFARCRNGLIISMNNDIMVTDGWLEKAVAVMESNPQVGIVGMKFLWPWDERIQFAGGTFIKGDQPSHIGIGEPREAHSDTRDVLWVSGPCVLIRRQALDPGWDEEYDGFGGHEDVDLCLRARSQGWRVVYCGKSEVYHHEGATVMALEGYWETFERHRLLFTSKWRGSPLLKEQSLSII